MLQVYISKKKIALFKSRLKKKAVKKQSPTKFLQSIFHSTTRTKMDFTFLHTLSIIAKSKTRTNLSRRTFPIGNLIHTCTPFPELKISSTLSFILEGYKSFHAARRQSTERERKRGGLNIRRQRRTRNKNYESLEAILHFKRESPRRMLGGQNSRRLLEIGRVNKILI